jgi:hypothetical protein
VADDKPAPGAPPDDTAAKRPGPADSLGTLAMTSPAIGAPPAMPGDPPSMPAGPPAMPSAAAPPAMPTAAAVVGLVIPPAAPSMPTAAEVNEILAAVR